MRIPFAALFLALAGCAAIAPGDESSSSEASLRAMTEREILGEIIYGETLDVDYAPEPRYRAYWFSGHERDYVQVQVISRDATDPVLWLTDESFNVLAMNNDVSVTSTTAQAVQFLPKTGKYFVVFREMNAAPRAKFSVSVRQLGAMPADCDPDGEGIIDPDCTDPPDFDPFDPASCEGPDLSPSEAKARFGGANGLRLRDATIYYRTRQCEVTAGVPDCSPWVHAHGMNVDLVKVTAAAPEMPDTYSVVADVTRKVQVDFSVGPVATKQFCVDGPFQGARGEGWSPREGGTPGVCAASATATVTSTCARLQPPTLQLGAVSAGYYTEIGPVLLARY